MHTALKYRDALEAKTSGYTIPYLKGQRGLNKATAYIAPLQNNLPLQSIMTETSTEDMIRFMF